jgi:beta-aspartyl-peptidase (threonine type)
MFELASPFGRFKPVVVDLLEPGLAREIVGAVAAHELTARIRLGREPLQQALDGVLADIASLGGKGGLIAVSPTGEAAWGFTTPAMYRGMADAAGRFVAIYPDADER